MKLYGGIDLHSNNSVIVLSDEEDKVVYRRRLANDIELVLAELVPFDDAIEGLVVESTYNWYWLVDGLMEAGYRVHLANMREQGQVLQSSTPIFERFEPAYCSADGGIVDVEMVCDFPHRVNTGEEGAGHCFAAAGIGALVLAERPGERTALCPGDFAQFIQRPGPEREALDEFVAAEE
jgi:hypothetical protein